MILQIGKVYKSLAGCPVKLLEINSDYVRVEYVFEVNHYGYGKGAIGQFKAADLREWDEEAIQPASLAEVATYEAECQEHRFDEDYDDEGDYDDDRYESERWEKCSCPFCYCSADTEYGEVCNDCLAGSHQG